MAELRGVERLWFSSDPAARVARWALAPLELAYGGVVALRGALYDAGILPSRVPGIPALSVGNLTVGGTGKTPVSAWLANELAARGARPAIVLRGYGRDEPIVHRRLNPGMAVVESPDRLAGIARAADAGANIAVLDDAFQHRRSGRAADIVLVSADRWTERRHLLPAGPWREPLAALRRASLVIVTRKAATFEDAERVAERVRAVAPTVQSAIMYLGLGALLPAADAQAGAQAGPHASPLPAAALAGQPVLAISAIGDAESFARQLASLGALVEARPFADHHHFTTDDVGRLAAAAGKLASRASEGAPVAICTLKDAVKLAPLWPREASCLWYVSQQPKVESDRAAIDALLTAVLAAVHRQP